MFFVSKKALALGAIQKPNSEKQRAAHFEVNRAHDHPITRVHVGRIQCGDGHPLVRYTRGGPQLAATCYLRVLSDVR